MPISALLDNNTLTAALIAWTLAQVIKVPLDFVRTKRVNWAVLLSVGGMPSSHSSLVTAMAYGVGLRAGFDSQMFAVAMILAIVVVYDAAGIRRQAGKHAAVINAMIEDLAAGHPLKEEQLREVLGHTPLQVLAGILLGIIVAQAFWMLWR